MGWTMSATLLCARFHTNIGLAPYPLFLLSMVHTPGVTILLKKLNYRDVLFLAIGVLGRQNVDLVALQREFTAAANRLTATASPLRPSDAPPAPPAICCRHYFSPLHLTKLHWHRFTAGPSGTCVDPNRRVYPLTDVHSWGTWTVDSDSRFLFIHLKYTSQQVHSAALTVVYNWGTVRAHNLLQWR